MRKNSTLPIKELISIDHLHTNLKFSNFIFDEKNNITKLYLDLKKSIKKLDPDAVDIYIKNITLKLYHDENTDSTLLNVYDVYPKISLLVLRIFNDLDLIQSTLEIPCKFIEQKKLDPFSQWNPDINGGLDFFITCKLMNLTFGVNSRSLLDNFFEFNFNNNASKFVKKANKSAFGTLDKTQDKEHLNTVDAKYNNRHLSLEDCMRYSNFNDYKDKKVTFFCKICKRKHTDVAQNALRFFTFNLKNKTAKFSCTLENTDVLHQNDLNILNDTFMENAIDYVNHLKIDEKLAKLYLLLYIYNNKNYYGFQRSSNK